MRRKVDESERGPQPDARIDPRCYMLLAVAVTCAAVNDLTHTHQPTRRTAKQFLLSLKDTDSLWAGLLGNPSCAGIDQAIKKFTRTPRHFQYSLGTGLRKPREEAEAS